MSNHVYNGVSCSGIMGNIDIYRKWIIYVWEIEPTTMIPMKHNFINDLNELDLVTKELNEQNIEYVVVLQDKNNNYIPIKYSDNDLKLSIETAEEYWDRVAKEYLEEMRAKEEELVCANM